MPLRIGDHLLQVSLQKIAAEVNDMVKQLNLFSMEVTRVAREVVPKVNSVPGKSKRCRGCMERFD